MTKWTMNNIKLDPVNREILPKQVKRLEESISKNGYFNGAPIVVNKDGYIIDGQHRFMACKNLGITPVIVEDNTENMIPVINSTQMSWNNADYIHYYAEKGLEDYVILRSICKQKNISPKVAEVIITGKSSVRESLHKSGGSLNLIRAGQFKLPDKSNKGLAKLERKIDAILNVVSLLGLPKTERLILAISRLAQDKNFVFSVLEQKIQYQRSKIYRCTTIDEFKTMLATIYNYKNTKKVAA